MKPNAPAAGLYAAASLALPLALMQPAAQAQQAWPTKPVRLLVPFPVRRRLPMMSLSVDDFR